MDCILIFLLYVFLLICNVEANIMEKGQAQEMLAESITPYPIVFSNISNDIEVFKENFGPQKEKQEEEPVVEPEGEEEAPPEAEEPKEEEAEAEVESDAEPEAEPAAEAGAETTVEADEPKQKDPAAEPESEEKPNPAPEPVAASGEEEENVQPVNGPNSPEGAAENDESDMPNDEPIKEEEKDQVTKVDTDIKDINKNGISCFVCTSNDDPQCPLKAKQQVTCPKGNAGDAGKHNGCYTLYQADTNITMRGCVDELAEDGLKFCLTNDKLCNVCYSNDCNDKVAPSSAAKIEKIKLNLFSLFFFATSSTIIRELASFTLSK